MTQPKFVGLSTGRAGSLFIARVMQKAGLAVWHEHHFRADQYVDGRPRPWSCEVLGEWSAQAVPFVQELAEDGWLVWHQVRHPLKTIGSLLGFKLFHKPRLHGEGGVFIAEHAGITGKDPVGEACRFYLDWNRRIETYAHRRWQVEQVDDQLLVELAADLHVDLPYPDAQAALAAVSTSTNHKHNLPPVPFGWDDVPPEWRDDLQQMAVRYGYGV